MRADQVVTGAIILATAAILIGYSVQYRRRQRRQQPPELAWLAGPPRMPAGHPERCTPVRSIADLLLQERATEMWPNSEWQATLLCPHPQLTGHQTRQEAVRAADRGRRASITRCACGTFHVHYRDRRGVVR
ncbi:hypothetical protein AB0C27_40695 [Nonomuraea sp. NPDC048882]|uniref:hypothetical protein n=1 Tax=Nonomuraea sp. NPDC048882 TaxID=3154347 RepID=UPI0033DCFF33